MAGKTGKLFNIPAGSDFLRTLVDSLLEGRLVQGFAPLKDQTELSKATLYVPNRRAARALAVAFLSRFESGAVLLPTIRTLGDTEDDEFGLLPDVDERILLTEPIQPINRKLQLAFLIQAWGESISPESRKWFGDEHLQIPANKSDSIKLASDLAALLDQITQEEIEWKAVHNLIPEDHNEWWRLTSTFLRIVMDNWPEHLAQRGLMDPAERSVKLLELRAKRYLDSGSTSPVIVAGSTGSVPSTRKLLEAVATLEKSAIVLPGLNMIISEQEWELIQNGDLSNSPLIESHSQFGLARTLKFLGVDRKNVSELAAPSSDIMSRNRILSTAMSLSEFSGDWRNFSDGLDDESVAEAFARVCLIEAVNERQEAQAIAIAMREVLEQKKTTAALVTPDRNLALRVSMELLRYGIEIDDSAGIPLSETAPAILARLICKIGCNQYSNSDLVALLKHPLMGLGTAPDKARKFADWFELLAVRGHMTSPVVGKFCERLEEVKKQLGDPESRNIHFQKIGATDWEELADWALKLDKAFEELITLSSVSEPLEVSGFFSGLLRTLISLTETDTGYASLNETPGSSELSKLISELAETNEDLFRFPADEAPTVFDALLEGQVSRSARTTHPRLHIYGPLEARLLDHDRIILAGLNEETWPTVHRNDAFLNRAMRRSLGMPSPERRTGLAAHDFQQLMAKKEVIVSRSARSGKTPTVASRWLQRLLALIGEKQSARIRERGQQYLNWASALDETENPCPRIKRPCVTPALTLRPGRLAVTDIEAWIRDPYVIYAKKILKLRPLEPLEPGADARIKGNLYHAVMESYVHGGGPTKTPEERISLLQQLWDRQMALKPVPVDIEYQWSERFREIARAYVEWELAYQDANPDYQSFCEIRGETAVADTGFVLMARADRIDVGHDGSIRVFDYKTGNSPSPEQARTLSPQLALESYIAEQGGFEKIRGKPVSDMRYLRLRTEKPIGKEDIHSKNQPVSEIIQKASEELKKLVLAYQNEEQGYISRRAPFMESEMSGDYDHLARVREWSFGEDNDG